MFDVLTSYTFIISAVSSAFLGFSAGMIGTVSVLKGQSLIGDAIGHSTFPGIVIAFMIFQTKMPIILMLGALFTGIVAFIIIHTIDMNSKIKLDTALAIVLSSMFGLGMVLKSYIQGNKSFSGSSQAGLENYIFGQAAFITELDMYVIIVVSIISVLILLIFYKEIKLSIFDIGYAEIIRFRPKIISYVSLIITIMIITVGLKTVGAVLVSSMIIIPAVTALQWSNKFERVLFIAGFIGMITSIIGTYFGSIKNGYPNGPAIIVVMAIVAIISILFGKYGIIKKLFISRRKI